MFNLCILAFASLARIQSHLIVGDPDSAVAEAHVLMEDAPSIEAQEWLIKSLAAAGKEGEMMIAWEALEQEAPEKARSRELLEEMCWGILVKGRRAPAASTQLISLIGCALSQDVRAVRVLQEALHNSNAVIRCVAVELSSLYGDHPLRVEIARLFQTERTWEVRQKLVGAIGKLKLKVLMPALVEIVSSPRSAADEKKEAIKALAEMSDAPGHSEIEALATSRRAGLRSLACACIAVCGLKEERALLIPLTEDTHPEVSASAWRALGLLRLEPPPCTLPIHDPKVGIPAAWAQLLAGDSAGEKALRDYLGHEKQEVRTLAAAAIASAGPYGVFLAQEFLHGSEDPYVRANLAVGLIGQRVDVEAAAAQLDDFLQMHPEQLKKVEGHFAPIQKNDHIHNPSIPNFPEVVNQTTRLELLNLLAIVEYPGAREAIKRFLKERKWGVTGLAAEMLLNEGDESALDLVRELLDDPDPQVACEAALALAVWGKDNSSLPTLMRAYHKGDRQLKIKILEALGRVGDQSTIPFLIERLSDPSQTLRMIAATVLIQTLNK